MTNKQKNKRNHSVPQEGDTLVSPNWTIVHEKRGSTLAGETVSANFGIGKAAGLVQRNALVS
jgi:hypothetical protein